MIPEDTIAHQFEDFPQQRDAVTLGMWIFLGTEILFFGSLFLAYAVYRHGDPEVFRAASNHTLLWAGTLNTGLLLLSSLTMALGVHAADEHQPLRMSGFLAATAFLGAVFLAIKGYEYYHEISEGLLPGASFHLDQASAAPAQMFFYLYFVMTGIHALHLTIGIGLAGVFLARTVFSRSPRRLALAVNQLGLYWHFVDLVWVFLFPLFYLAGRAS